MFQCTSTTAPFLNPVKQEQKKPGERLPAPRKPLPSSKAAVTGTVLVTPCCIGLSDIKVAQTEERVRVDLHPSSQNKSSVAATTKTGKDTPTATQAKPTRSQRWVPPSARENLDPTEVIFRKVRGILNKLTPDNFERQSRDLIHHACSSSREIRKGAILLVFDKALDESNYSFMYAQLCLRLNDYTPTHPQADDQKAGSFRKLLLHKCQEEFQNRKRATADFEARHGEVLSVEEEEQMGLAKRKMLGNIKFVGELYKLGVLHEAIIHSCIKELLERKRGQSVEDTSQSVECLCHFMTTVGNKLDTSKAKSWMDQYFSRMIDLASNKDLSSRIRFMLMDVIELRNCKWVPRRVAAGNSPRPIHLIRHEAYQEHQSSGGGGRSRGGAHPHLPHPAPHSSLDISQHEMRGQGSSQYSGRSGDEGFTSSPFMQDTLLSPQDQTQMTFAPHTVPLLLHKMQSGHPGSAEGTGEEVSRLPARKKQIRKLYKSDNTVSLRPTMQSLKIGSSSSRNKPASAATPIFPEPTNLSEGPLDGTQKSGGAGGGKGVSKVVAVPTHIPRTRDDSSDEEDRSTKPPSQGIIPTPPPGGHAAIQLHHFLGGGNFPPLHHHHLPPPPAHMMLPQQPLPPQPSGPPGGVEHFQAFLGREFSGPAPLLPPTHAGMGRSVKGLLPHQPRPPMMYMSPPSPGSRPLSSSPVMVQYGTPGPPVPMGTPSLGYFPPLSTPPGPPQGHSFMPSPPGSSYGQIQRSLAPYPGQPWIMPSQDRPHPAPTRVEPEGDKSSPRLPNLERNEPIIKYKPTKKSGSVKKCIQDACEKSVASLIKSYLRSHNVEESVEEVRRQLGASVATETLCILCITKTLEKSEDDRTHMSNLFEELHTRDLINTKDILQALMTVIGSSHCAEPQNKMYLAGFVARAVAKNVLSLKDVCPMFEQGAHHPTLLVFLQALTSLLGESEVFQMFKASEFPLASLLPLEYRSHTALSNLVEAKHLSFLYPLKRIQSALAAKLRHEASALSIYKWIKANVDSSLYPTADFVMVLSRCILDCVTSSSSLSSTVCPSDNPSKEMVTREKECMEKFKILVQKFVSDRDSLQVSVLYATQVFCHDKGFPKGLLLRIFSYWYDMDVIEEESFFKWKEDVHQQYPGKGLALFQVNQWLVLLAESDDEGSSDDNT